MPIDYYEVLGVSETAGPEDIQRAYRQQALRWHPDKHAAEMKEVATERFKAVNAAYQVLSNDERRRAYNTERAAAASSGSAMPGQPVSLAEAWEIFISFVISACARQFEGSPAGAGRLVRLLSSLGITAALPAAMGTSGGAALCAISLALLNSEGAVSVYRDLSDEQKVAFSQAVVMLSRTLE